MHFHDMLPLMMEGGKYKKGKGKQSGRAEKSDKIATEVATVDEHGECNSGRGLPVSAITQS